MVEVGSLVKVEYSASVDGVEVEKPGPLVVAVGKNHVLKGLDEALQAAEVGKEESAVVPPEKGYGQRNADLVRLVPIEVFRKQGINPAPGMPLELDNLPCHVQSVSGGRVRVDFNHELAGKTIEYKFKITEQLSTDVAKVEAIARQFLGSKVSAIVDGSGKVATITVDPEACLREGYVVSKGRALAMILSFVDGVESVKVIEEYSRAKMAVPPSDATT